MSIFHFLFEQINSWYIRENKDFKRTYEDEIHFQELHQRFHPIYVLNERDENSINEFFEIQRAKFVEEEGVFDKEEFEKFILINFCLRELNQYLNAIDKSKCGVYDKENGINLLWFRLEFDKYTDTLLFTKKSITQVKLYCKTVIQTIESRLCNSENGLSIQAVQKEKNLGFRSTYFTQNSDKIRLFKKLLVKNGLIHNDTKQSILSKVFSGEIVDEQILWTGKLNQLKYLINQLIYHNIINKDEKKWTTASNCFLKNDGNLIKHSNLKGAKEPLSSNQHIIDDLLRELRR